MDNKWLNNLYDIYGDKLTCCIGEPYAKIQYNLNSNQYDIAVYCNKKYKIAIVWDVKHRIQNGWKGTTLSFAKNWNEIVLSDDGLECFYKRFNTTSGRKSEKILAVSFDTLDKIKYDLYEYLKFDIDDIGIPKKSEDTACVWTNAINRERISTSTWKRNYKFRKAVLENYNYKCAICDCGEEKILEAAHIIPVNSSGNDKVENGICLCRNHHRMFDEKLIELNFENHTIINISKSVEKYVNNGKTFSRGKHESKKSST